MPTRLPRSQVHANIAKLSNCGLRDLSGRVNPLDPPMGARWISIDASVFRDRYVMVALRTGL